MRAMALLTAIIECPGCCAEFEACWEDDSMDPEQRDSAPESLQECPHGCPPFLAEYPGWGYMTEAG